MLIKIYVKDANKSSVELMKYILNNRARFVQMRAQFRVRKLRKKDFGDRGRLSKFLSAYGIEKMPITIIGQDLFWGLDDCIYGLNTFINGKGQKSQEESMLDIMPEYPETDIHDEAFISDMLNYQAKRDVAQMGGAKLKNGLSDGDDTGPIGEEDDGPSIEEATKKMMAEEERKKKALGGAMSNIVNKPGSGAMRLGEAFSDDDEPGQHGGGKLGMYMGEAEPKPRGPEDASLAEEQMNNYMNHIISGGGD